MPPESESPWKRVGRLLADRRVEIAARYKNKNLFAEEREINRRMLWSVESGKRDNYGRETLRAVERAYMLAPGSVERAVAGGDLEPLGTPASLRAVPAAPPVTEGSPAERERNRLLAEYPDDEVLPLLAAQRGKKVSMVVAEMLDWLGSQGPWAPPQENNGTAGLTVPEESSFAYRALRGRG